jgi:erythromycin esterase-like protein
VSVTEVSARSAWAVGGYFTGTAAKTLILHWNGAKWTRAASPNPPGSVTDIALNGVSATSSSNAWAVGSYTVGGIQKIITVRWNGRAWKIVASPSPASSPALAGVAAISASDAWAVGSHVAGSKTTLIMHWNGRKWAKAPSPSPGVTSTLNAVTATSAGNVWAVGNFDSGTQGEVLAIHCC